MGEGFIVDYDRMRTDFLCAQPSRLFGIARLLDLLGVFTLYNVSATPRDADNRAMFSDWVMVGKDLNNALAEFEAHQHDLVPPLVHSL